MTKLTAAVVGATGYTGLELVQRLSIHPNVELTACYCQTPRSWDELLPNLASSLPPLQPMAKLSKAQVMFFCLPHSASASVVAKMLPQTELLLDLSADFRLRTPALYEKYYGFTHPAPQLLKNATYGLVERVKEFSSNLIAVPGCYPTAILLALLPLVEAGVIGTDGIAISALSGISGGGATAQKALMFCETAESVRAYKVGTHRHLSEINQQLSHTAGKEVQVVFTPHLVPMIRGLYATITAPLSSKGANGTSGNGTSGNKTSGNGASSKGGDKTGNKTPPQKVLTQTLEKAYASSPFVKVVQQPPSTLAVRNTNFCHLFATTSQNQAVVIAAIDNLVKGAAGQAIQAMNHKLGFVPTAGLGTGLGAGLTAGLATEMEAELGAEPKTGQA